MSWTRFELAAFGMTNQHSTPELPAININNTIIHIILFLYTYKFEMGIEPMTQ
jgi:hypothetical protein